MYLEYATFSKYNTQGTQQQRRECSTGSDWRIENTDQQHERREEEETTVSSAVERNGERREGRRGGETEHRETI